MFIYDKEKELEKIEACIAAGEYKDTWDSLAKHKTPQWFLDANLPLLSRKDESVGQENFFMSGGGWIPSCFNQEIPPHHPQYGKLRQPLSHLHPDQTSGFLSTSKRSALHSGRRL